MATTCYLFLGNLTSWQIKKKNNNNKKKQYVYQKIKSGENLKASRGRRHLTCLSSQRKRLGATKRSIPRLTAP